MIYDSDVDLEVGALILGEKVNELFEWLKKSSAKPVDAMAIIANVACKLYPNCSEAAEHHAKSLLSLAFQLHRRDPKQLAAEVAAFRNIAKA